MTPVVLGRRLNVGGVWYNTGSVIPMEDKDAADYFALRMARAATAAEAAGIDGGKPGPASTPHQQRNVKVGDIITKDETGPRDPVPDPDPDGDEGEDEASKPQGQDQPQRLSNPGRSAKRGR